MRENCIREEKEKIRKRTTYAVLNLDTKGKNNAKSNASIITANVTVTTNNTEIASAASISGTKPPNTRITI